MTRVFCLCDSEEFCNFKVMSQTPTAVFTIPASEPFRHRFIAFSDPIATWSVSHAADMRKSLDRVHELQCAGYYVCAAFTYEAAAAFDRALVTHLPGKLPLAWFAAFGSEHEFSPEERGFTLGEPRFTIDKDGYVAAVRKILEHIRSGDIYQANFTVRALCDFSGDAFSAFCALQDAVRTPYACYINTGETQIVSMSPELFIERTGNVIHSQPMKGTAARRPSWDEDEAARLALKTSEKDRAELTMIVDLMRNDFGRICRTGTVEIFNPFTVTRYPTVHQMTTRVHGELMDKLELFDIFRAVFPAGSITGAPKIRATKIIYEAEKSARGIYCGSLALFKPEGDFFANVAIRTLEISGNIATVGVGSGIVADSDPEREWDEVLLKAKFTRLRPQKFALYESFRYEPKAGFQNLSDHMNRLRHSCKYYGRPFPEDKIRAKLHELQMTLADAPNRVRLDLDGEEISFKLIPEELGWSPEGVTVMIPELRLDPDDPRLYHKTTLRPEKYTLRAKAKSIGAEECLFLNTRNEFTEGTISSFLFQTDGKWIAPALACGLLPGIWRDHQIHSGRAREGIVSFSELDRVERIVIGNSVRGEQDVVCIILEDGTEVYRKEKIQS